MREKIAVISLPLLVLLLLGLQSVSPSPPNIVIISVDTLRADHLSCYDYPRNTTPNICSFAEESVMFTEAVAQAPWTVPSHATLFSGTYPSVHGAQSVGRNELGEETLTLAERLQQRGYATAAFVGAVEGENGSIGGGLHPGIGFDQGFETYHASVARLNRRPRNFLLSNTVPSALSWLQKKGEEPFFLFVHGYDPHMYFFPIDNAFNYSDSPAMATFRKMYPSTVEKRAIRLIRHTSSGPAIMAPNRTIPMNRTDISYLRGQYDSWVRRADRWVGRLLEGLRNENEYEDSVIIILGDHGEMLGERPLYNDRLFGHATLYEEVLHVPLIIRFPDVKPQTVQTPVELVDIVPTLLDVVNIEPVKGENSALQGETLLQVLGGRTLQEPYVFAEETTPRRFMVRNATWKLISDGQGNPLNIYNIRSDPDESTNLASTNISVKKALIRRIHAWKNRNTVISSR